jgi:hypothetical protein
MGGKALAKQMTKKERQESARRAAQARWADKNLKKTEALLGKIEKRQPKVKKLLKKAKGQ